MKRQNAFSKIRCQICNRIGFWYPLDFITVVCGQSQFYDSHPRYLDSPLKRSAPRPPFFRAQTAPRYTISITRIPKNINQIPEIRNRKSSTVTKHHEYRQRYSRYGTKLDQTKPDISMLLLPCSFFYVQSRICKNILVVVVVVAETEKKTESKSGRDKFSSIGWTQVESSLFFPRLHFLT
jgi:hypothetical protein